MSDDIEDAERDAKDAYEAAAEAAAPRKRLKGRDKRALWVPPGWDPETGWDWTDEHKAWTYSQIKWQYNTPEPSLRARRKMLGPRVRAKEKAPGLPIEMATMWTGRPGSGKTSGMCEAAYWMKRLGWRVLTNGLELSFEDGRYDSLEELTEIITKARDYAGERVPTCILLDEAPFWANARKWSKFPDGFFSVLQQVRKFGLALHYSSISPMQTDVNLRRLTLWWWVCSPGIFNSFVRELWTSEEERVVGEKARTKKRRWHRQWTHKMYDTLQLLDPLGTAMENETDEQKQERLEHAAEVAEYIAQGNQLGQPEGPVRHVIGPAAKETIPDKKGKK